MKIRSWFMTSLIFLLLLGCTIGLFNYWDQMKSDSYRGLQKRLGEMEWQRVEADKVQQIRTVAQKTADNFEQWVHKKQSMIEAIADAAPLRKTHATSIERENKKREFLKILSAKTQILTGLLVDEAGQVIASSATSDAEKNSTIGNSYPFQNAARQRITTLQILKISNAESHLEVTVPCLSTPGGFLGVLQAEVALPTEVIKTMAAQSGFQIILGSEDGRRITKGLQEKFPEFLGVLIDKNVNEMQTLLQPATVQQYKAHWENKNYLMASIPTQIAKVYLFVFLEVSDLEKVVGPANVNQQLYEDPVILGGLIFIVLIGLVLFFITSSSNEKAGKKLNQQLTTLLQLEKGDIPLEISGSGVFQKIAEQINLLIKKTQAAQSLIAMPETSVDEEATQKLKIEVTRAKSEIENLHSSYDQTLMQNQELASKITDLEQHLQNLQKELNAAQQEKANLPVIAPQENGSVQEIEKIKENLKAAGTLRIEAISSISEDLKATLQVIKNYISSILALEEGKITDTQQEFLGVVINKSARLERQINDLLDISHMESGNSQLFRSRTDLVSMLQDVVLNSQPQADIKHVQIIQDIHSPIPILMIDSDRLGQVFITLVQYAIKITPVNGEVQVSAMDSFSDIVIKIRDSGTPLTTEQAGHVFNTFHGTDSNAGPDIASSGLRFSIIKRIVDSHQGMITMRGLPNQGNETVITFSKTDEMLAPAEEISMLSMYEIKPKGPSRSLKTETTKAETPYDLAAFIGKMGELENESTGSNHTTAAEKTSSGFPGAHEDLDKLLNDIENMDGNLNK